MRRDKYGEVRHGVRRANAAIPAGYAAFGLFYMRNCLNKLLVKRGNFSMFYTKEILYTLCSQLSWSHLRLIMRLDTEKERTYYVEQARMGSWSVRELERNIRTDMFHRVVQNQLPEDNTAPNIEKTNATQSKTIASQIKDPYILQASIPSKCGNRGWA